MTFQNLNAGRVFQAIAVVVIAGFILSSMLLICSASIYASSGLDSSVDQGTQQNIINEKANEFWKDSSLIHILFVICWLLTALVIFWMSYRTATREANTPEQAVGYGVAIGFGTALLYGGLCGLTALGVPSGGTSLCLLQLAFWGLFVLAGGLAGQLAGQRLDPSKRRLRPAAQPGFGSFGSAPQPPAGANVEVYYNMGVSAAVGARRQEARQHFTRVVQMNPYHVAAWLQLANLADTPEQAWNYVQQARAIAPNDSAVLHAVSVIWPQVAASAMQPPSHAAPASEVPAPATVPPPAHIQPPEKAAAPDFRQPAFLASEEPTQMEIKAVEPPTQSTPVPAAPQEGVPPVQPESSTVVDEVLPEEPAPVDAYQPVDIPTPGSAEPAIESAPADVYQPVDISAPGSSEPAIESAPADVYQPVDIPSPDFPEPPPTDLVPLEDETDEPDQPPPHLPE